MNDSTITRHGSHLMSLASLAAFVACFLWLASLIHLIANPGSTDLSFLHPFGIRIQSTAQTASAAPWQYVIALLPSLLAVLLPCLALRHLGASLYRGILLAPELAQGLRLLGRTLSFSAVLSLFIGPFLDSVLTHGQLVSVGVTTSVFIEIVGALLAFSMARVVNEALRVEQENLSFL